MALSSFTHLNVVPNPYSFAFFNGTCKETFCGMLMLLFDDQKLQCFIQNRHLLYSKTFKAIWYLIILAKLPTIALKSHPLLDILNLAHCNHLWDMQDLMPLDISAIRPHRSEHPTLVWRWLDSWKHTQTLRCIMTDVQLCRSHGLMLKTMPNAFKTMTKRKQFYATYFKLSIKYGFSCNKHKQDLCWPQCIFVQQIDLVNIINNNNTFQH